MFVNGVPVATAELKNALTGQYVEDAKESYRVDRYPKNVTLARRAVVHFALDTEQVAITTRLADASTRFLPFNHGHGGGKGNPLNPDGHRTAYLWERVWPMDARLDLLGRFVHVERGVGAKGAKSPAPVIFPRYRQWDAVRRRLGLRPRLRLCHAGKLGKDDRDLFGLHLNQALINSVGMAAAANVGQKILEVGGKDLRRVHARPPSFPVEAAVVEIDKNGQRVKKKLFYGRFGNGTRAISDPTQRDRYQLQFWRS